MGEDEADAQAVVHIRGSSLGHTAAAAQPSVQAASELLGRLARHNSEKRLAAPQPDHIPRFETGEPQYQFGDGGGPPSSSDSRYQEVMGVSLQYDGAL